jgi:diphthamide synthase (EF-2-diphthine--ammonia ligase)
MSMTPREIHIEHLKRQLRRVREKSLEATRRGDFMQVAKLTATAQRLNVEIMTEEGEHEAAQYGAKPSEAAPRTRL